jgi:hypothetical protein
LGDELTSRPDAEPPARARDPRADVIGGLAWMRLITTEHEREGAKHADQETDTDDEQD